MVEAAVPRVFFALWPDEQILDALDAIATLGIKHCGGQRMRRDSLHLTLAFIGAVSPRQLVLLQEVADGIVVDAFDLQLDRLGYWPHNRILWAGCSAAPPWQRRLFIVLTELLTTAGFQLDQRPYLPHLTLVRHARCANLPEFSRPLQWHVGAFALVESLLQPSGARYRILQHWPLREIP